jgi:hypothetical protein
MRDVTAEVFLGPAPSKAHVWGSGAATMWQGLFEGSLDPNMFPTSPLPAYTQLNSVLEVLCKTRGFIPIMVSHHRDSRVNWPCIILDVSEGQTSQFTLEPQHFRSILSPDTWQR